MPLHFNRIFVKFNTILASIFMVAGIVACDQDDDNATTIEPNENEFVSLLTNQVDEVILPSVRNYETAMLNLDSAVQTFAANPKQQHNLDAVKNNFKTAYLAFQAVGVHNYFATATSALVVNTNLYPVDTSLLNSFIENRTYQFNDHSQRRANGFPAIDFMLHHANNSMTYFENDKRLDFLVALVQSMRTNAVNLSSSWNSFRNDFIENGGVALGSSVSVQLNQSIIYYELRVREDKVGIPIGRLGPNDSPIPADQTKIEAYYLSLEEGNESFTLALVRAAIEEMEDLYLGSTLNGEGQGYDDLLIARNQSSVDKDIKNQFEAIYTILDNRSSISGDETLYLAVQRIITLYKTDLLPLLNVQDADGANDGD